jgi:hypothetical protein
MNWRKLIRRFGLRFAISFAILSLGYLALFGWPATSSKRTPVTATEKIAALRAALNQTLIASGYLNNFSDNSIVASHTLANQVTQLTSANQATQIALKAAPRQLESETRREIQAILGRHEQAIQLYQGVNATLSKAISYDPQTDLGKLDLTKDGDKLVQRARAAQEGLKKTASATSAPNSSAGLNVQRTATAPPISDKTRQALQGEIDCLDQLAQPNKDVEAAQRLRLRCINDYATLRSLAVADVTTVAFPQEYQATMKRSTLPILRQLDRLLKTI